MEALKTLHGALRVAEYFFLYYDVIFNLNR